VLFGNKTAALYRNVWALSMRRLLARIMAKSVWAHQNGKESLRSFLMSVNLLLIKRLMGGILFAKRSDTVRAIFAGAVSLVYSVTKPLVIINKTGRKAVQYRFKGGHFH